MGLGILISSLSGGIYTRTIIRSNKTKLKLAQWRKGDYLAVLCAIALKKIGTILQRKLCGWKFCMAARSANEYK